jgi:hypothetical protein
MNRGKEAMASNKLEWRGIDGAGFQYGFYREGDQHYRIDIALPGKGLGDPHKGQGYKLYIDGNEIGKKDTLKEAVAFLERFFERGLHRPRGRASLADKLASIAGLKPKGRGGGADRT